ncbi:MAG: hypothetical protein Q9199_006238 [Rusavskia elegans]
MQACAKQYAEGLDGRSPFDPEKECCLKQDLYVLKHQYGYREDCDCEICDKRRRSVWLFAVLEKLKGYHLWWKQFRSRMEEYPWRCWWIDWTLDHRFWPNECKCEECETALNEKLQRRVLYLEEQDYSLDQMMAYQQMERCKRLDHIRKKLKNGPLPWKYRMKRSVVEECKDCEESKEEEQCDWCNDRHPVSTKPKNKSKNVWWRDLCDYPMDFWMSWERELHPHIDYGHHPSEICHSIFCGSCVWEKTRGLLGKEASRLSVLARLGLIGNMVWQSIWTRKEEPAESEEE